MASLDKWEDYTKAKEAMFMRTDTSDAPWTVIKADCKKRAWLNAMRFLLHRLPYEKRNIEKVGQVDRLIVGRPSLVPGRGDDQLASPIQRLSVPKSGGLSCFSTPVLWSHSLFSLS